jgi:hypothetical protein
MMLPSGERTLTPLGETLSWAATGRVATSKLEIAAVEKAIGFIHLDVILPNETVESYRTALCAF